MEERTARRMTDSFPFLQSLGGLRNGNQEEGIQDQGWQAEGRTEECEEVCERQQVSERLEVEVEVEPLASLRRER
jgi:hypothetical protein